MVNEESSVVCSDIDHTIFDLVADRMDSRLRLTDWMLKVGNETLVYFLFRVRVMNVAWWLTLKR